LLNVQHAIGLAERATSVIVIAGGKVPPGGRKAEMAKGKIFLAMTGGG